MSNRELEMYNKMVLEDLELVVNQLDNERGYCNSYRGRKD